MEGLSILLTVFCLRYTIASILSESVNFIQNKKLPFVTGYFCDDLEKYELSKRFAATGIRSNFPIINKISTVKDLDTGLFFPSSQTTGVIINLKCNNTKQILKIASDNRFFDITRHWLIFSPDYFDMNEFEEISKDLEPKMFDVKNYLEEGNALMRHGERIKELNKEINDQVLSDPTVIALFSNRTEKTWRKNSKEKLISFLVNLKAIIDSELTIAVPYNSTYNFYDIHRKTQFTRMEIKKFTPGNQQSSILQRRNFNGTLIRASAGLLYFEYLSRSDDLPTVVVDQWAIKGIQMTVMAEERYNFRMIIKCFDDYGWYTNGKYTGMVKFLNEERADMTTGGLLLITIRMDGISYVASSYKAAFGLLFKQPALSQVANIFVLPFSTSVWFCVILLLILTAIILILQFQLVERFEHAFTIRFLETFTFLTGAAFQQGSDLITHVVSARMTMVVVLISSLFFFTSYTANIVSLLQSSSNAINSVRDFLESSIEMGAENLPYQINLLEGDTDPLIRELFQKKLAEKRNKGMAYLNSTAGMQKMRHGLYAFHMEVEAGARIMRATFTESEKCHVKAIPLFPNRFNGHAVPKKSPFKEILQQFFIWYAEIGFLQRSEARFGYNLPKCAGNAASGFNSIGLSDIRSIVFTLLSGIALSFAIMIFENIYSRIVNKKDKKVFSKSTNKKKKGFRHDHGSRMNVVDMTNTNNNYLN